MGKVLAREALLVVLVGLFSWLGVPALLGEPPGLPLLVIGVLLALTFMPLYSVALGVGKRLPHVWRMWLGAFAWLSAFAGNLGMLRLASRYSPAALVTELAPMTFGLLLVVLAVASARGERRNEAGAFALFLYSLPMLVIRELLARAVSYSLVLTQIAILGGALYFFVHTLLWMYSPSPAEVEHPEGPLLRRRPVPDAVVGLVQGTLHRAAQPYGADDSAIVVFCKPDEVEGAVERLTAALAGRPFEVTKGSSVGNKVEIVVRAKE
jgi:hypothetical protein